MAQDRPQRIDAKEVALTSAGSWIGTILYFLFSAGFFLYALFGWREVVPILIAGFFAAWGVAAIVMMVRTGSSQGRYGPMPLQLEGPAPAVGGRLRASLTLPGTATSAMPLTLRAALICSTVTYTGKRRRMEEPLRGLQKDVAVARSSASTRVNFDIEIPVDLPPTDDPGAAAAVRGRAYASWELEVRSLDDEANLSRSYDIRVGGKQMVAVPGAPTVPAAVLAQDGPFEILRPGARAEAPLATPRPVLPAAVVTSAGAEDPPAPALVPGDDHRSLWVLVALNLIPLAGVLWAGWRVHEVVFLYWIENLVIGAVNVLRMRIAVPDTLPKLAKRGIEMAPGELFVAKAALIGFFIVHYGGFCMGHGIFLASFFPAGPDGSRDLAGVLRSMLLDKAALLAITGIVVSHAYSYFHNYIGRGEYLHADISQMMFRPYKRIVVTHLFIFAGAFALQSMGSPVAAMLAFIGLKIAIDGYAHLQERKLLAALEKRQE